MTNHTERYESVTATTIADRVPQLVEALADCRDPQLLDSLGRAEARLLLTLPLSKKGLPYGANTLKQKHLKLYYEAFRAVHNEIPVTASADRRGDASPHFCRAIVDELCKVIRAEAEATPAEVEAEVTTAEVKAAPEVNARAVLQLATKLINSKDWREIALGLQLAIGRRLTEVICTGEIDAAAKANFLRFRGVTKLKQDRWESEFSAWREIPCLLPTAEVSAAWQRLRECAEIVAYREQITAEVDHIDDAYERYLETNRRASSLTNRACNNALQSITAIHLVVPLRHGKSKPSTHDLRAVYGAIAVEREAKTTAINERRALYHKYLSQSDINYGDYGVKGGDVPAPKTVNKKTASIKCPTLVTLRLQRLESILGTGSYCETIDRLLDMAEATPAEAEVTAAENTTEATPATNNTEATEAEAMTNESQDRIAALEDKFSRIESMIEALVNVRSTPAEVKVTAAAAHVPAEPEQSYIEKQAEAAREWESTPSSVLFGWNGSGRAMKHAGAAYERARRVLEAAIEYNAAAESPAARIAINGGLIRGVTAASSKFSAQWLEYHGPMISDLHGQWDIKNPEYHNRDVFGGDPVAIITAAIKGNAAA